MITEYDLGKPHRRLSENPITFSTNNLNISVFYRPHYSAEGDFGGDSFLVEEIDNETTLVALMNGTGHGKEGRKVMSNCLNSIHSLIDKNLTLDELTSKWNDSICDNKLDLAPQFCTLVALKMQKKSLEYTIWGDSRLIVKSKKGIFLASTQTLVMGSIPSKNRNEFGKIPYRSISLSGDELILLFSDGVTDIGRTKTKNTWGIEGIIGAIADNNIYNSKLAIEKINEKASSYKQKTAFEDDYLIIGINHKN